MPVLWATQLQVATAESPPQIRQFPGELGPELEELSPMIQASRTLPPLPLARALQAPPSLIVARQVPIVLPLVP